MTTNKAASVGFGIGTPPNLVEALNALIFSLRDANESLGAKEPYVRAVGMMNALAATEKFMRSVWQFKGMKLDRPYAATRESIQLMIDGVEVDEFAPLRKPHNESHTTQWFKMQCAAAMDLFMHNGAKRKAAASRVVQIFPKLKIKAETVADWRDMLIGRSENQMAEHFKVLTSAFKQGAMSDAQITYCFSLMTKTRGVQLKRQPNRVVRLRKANKQG